LDSPLTATLCLPITKAHDGSAPRASDLRAGIAERDIAEVERVVRSYFDKRDDLEAVSRDELLQRSRAGAVTILDVRPEDEFALGHLPGALNIPLRVLEERLGEIEPKQEVVAYCRGPYCVLSYEAVALLRTRGFKARRLQDGLPEWRAAGFRLSSKAPGRRPENVPVKISCRENIAPRARPRRPCRQQRRRGRRGGRSRPRSPRR